MSEQDPAARPPPERRTSLPRRRPNPTLLRRSALAPRLWAPLLALAAVVMVGGTLVATRGGGGKQPAAPATTAIEDPPDTTADLNPTATSSTAPATTVTTQPGRPRTVTTLPTDISGGAARMSGNVVGPSGLVPNASIRVERLVGTTVSALNLTSAANGSFNFPSLRGGNYRVRAWLAPSLLLLQPEVFFLGAEEHKIFDLRLSAVGDTNVQTAVDPSPIPKDDPFNIVVTVYAGLVTADGALQGTTRNGLAVQISLRANLGLQGPERGTTDNSGQVVFRVRCVGAGRAEADAVVGTLRLPLTLPNCPS